MMEANTPVLGIRHKISVGHRYDHQRFHDFAGFVGVFFFMISHSLVD